MLLGSSTRSRPSLTARCCWVAFDPVQNAPVTFFDWLSQLRYTPSYTTVFALFAGGVLASTTTLFGVRKTLEHQRKEAESDRDHERSLKVSEAQNAHRDKQRDAIARLAGVGAEWRVGMLQGIDFARASAYSPDPKILFDARRHVYELGLRMQTAISDARLLFDDDSLLEPLSKVGEINDSLFEDVVRKLTSGILKLDPPDDNWQEMRKAGVSEGVGHLGLLAEGARRKLNEHATHARIAMLEKSQEDVVALLNAHDRSRFNWLKSLLVRNRTSVGDGQDPKDPEPQK